MRQQFDSIEHYDSVNESYTRSGQQIAFPDAQGYGGLAAGGRGGTLYFVDRLDDAADVEGTLRHAVEKAPRPLTVLFRVAGDIRLTGPLKIKRGRLTLDGGDAPDRGVCVSGADGVRIQAEDVIVRHLRFRLAPGDRTDDATDALTIRGPSRTVIVDRCSVSWGTDETLSVNASGSKTKPADVNHVRAVTVQRCIVAEPFGHRDGGHRFGSIFTGASGDRISVLRCLFVHCDSRVPRTGHFMDNEAMMACTLDFGSNVVYDWGKRPGYNGEEHDVPSLMNFVGNWYAPGPATQDRDRIFLEVGSRRSRGYFRDNALGGVVPSDPYSLVKFDDAWTAAEKYAYRHTAAMPTVNTTRVPVARMPDDVLDDVGCVLPERDSADRRVVDEVYAHGGALVAPDRWDDPIYDLPRLRRVRRAAFCYAVDDKSLRNDVAAIRQILLTQGYASTDFRVWPEATLADYKAAMKWLVGDGDLVAGDRLFFYSGSHGTQTADSDDSEDDGEDEAIVTSDHRKLLDDKVRNRLVKKIPRGVLLNAVIMACHSGTMADMEHNYRYVAGADGEPQLQHRDDDYKDVDGTVCVLTACADDKSTWSHKYGDVAYTALGGAFVLCAPMLLQTSGTYKDLLRGVWQKHVDEDIPTTPQLACQPARRIDDLFEL